MCDQGKLIEAPCRGPRGCSMPVEGVVCDVSGNKPGDPCSRDDEGAAACADAKSILVCRSGKFQINLCRGPDGCERSDGRPQCDTSIAEVGDGCVDADKPRACATDRKALLGCVDGKMANQVTCRGPDGCQIEAGKLNCDLTLAEAKDPCLSDMEGRHACSVDRKRILICKSGEMVSDSECDKKESCLTEGGSIRCGKAL